MKSIPASDKKLLIRLASSLPPGSEPRKSVLRAIIAGVPEWAEGKKFKNPETGNDVAFSSLPSEEQKKLTEAHKEKGEDNKGGGFTAKMKGLLSKFKGAKKDIVDSIAKAPEATQKMILDPETRKEAMGKLSEGLKSGAPLKKLIGSAKSEAHEIKHALHAGKKLFKKPPGPFSKEDKAALYSAGAYAAGAALAAIPPGTILAAAGACAHSFAMHVGIKTVSQVLDKGFLHFEWAETLMHGIHQVASMKVAGEDEEDEGMDSKTLFEALCRAIGENLKDLSEEDMQKIMAGVDKPE